MTDEPLLLDVTDGVAVVTLNRPAKRNALDRLLAVRIPEVMAGLAERDDVDVVILTGTDPAFCAGLDLVDAVAPGGLLDGTPHFEEPFAPLPVPLIGAINGPAWTGGLELALMCDWLIASERASFGDSHARVGVQPAGGMTVRLPRRVGLPRARQLSATGTAIDAATALAWGLVNEVVPHEDLLPRCRELAMAVGKADRSALRGVMATYRAHEDFDEAADRARERAAILPPDAAYDGGAIAARTDRLLPGR
jgi:enoyl-CoA hydratase